MSVPFLRGKDCTIRIFQQGKPVYVPAKNWDVSEEATEAADDVNGEDRSRLDKVTNYYSATVDIYIQDLEMMKKYAEAQEADDASVLPLKQSAAIQIKLRDGTRAAYALQEAKFGPFKKSFSGRTDAVMMQCKVRFRYYREIPAI